VGGDDSHVVFGQKFPGEKGNVRWCSCAVVMATASFVTKARGEVFAHFHAVTLKYHSSMWNQLFSLPGQILCEQSP
jgi:hypothetical protein